MLLVARVLARLGWLVLDRVADRRPHASAEELFARLWAFFRRFHFAFKIREYYCNPFGAPIENTVFRKLLRIVRCKHPDYRPQYEVINAGLIPKIVARDRRTILVTVHNGVSIAIIEILQAYGGRCSLFSIVPTSKSFGTIVGRSSEFNIINPGPDALVRARREMGEGRILCCHPDDGEGKILAVADRLHIKTGIFEYARRMDARIFYALAQVSYSGAVVVRMEEPRYSRAHCSAGDMARDFAAFLHAASSNRQTWQVC